MSEEKDAGKNNVGYEDYARRAILTVTTASILKRRNPTRRTDSPVSAGRCHPLKCPQSRRRNKLTGLGSLVHNGVCPKSPPALKKTHLHLIGLVGQNPMGIHILNVRLCRAFSATRPHISRLFFCFHNEKSVK
jgi:hypothetical protein